MTKNHGGPSIAYWAFHYVQVSKRNSEVFPIFWIVQHADVRGYDRVLFVHKRSGWSKCKFKDGDCRYSQSWPTNRRWVNELRTKLCMYTYVRMHMCEVTQTQADENQFTTVRLMAKQKTEFFISWRTGLFLWWWKQIIRGCLFVILKMMATSEICQFDNVLGIIIIIAMNDHFVVNNKATSKSKSRTFLIVSIWLQNLPW